MNKTAKRRNQKNNTTQKNKKKLQTNKNDCKYKSCKSKIYKSIYGGRYTTNIFF